MSDLFAYLTIFCSLLAISFLLADWLYYRKHHAQVSYIFRFASIFFIAFSVGSCIAAIEQYNPDNKTLYIEAYLMAGNLFLVYILWVWLIHKARKRTLTTSPGDQETPPQTPIGMEGVDNPAEEFRNTGEDIEQSIRNLRVELKEKRKEYRTTRDFKERKNINKEIISLCNELKELHQLMSVYKNLHKGHNIQPYIDTVSEVSSGSTYIQESSE